MPALTQTFIDALHRLESERDVDTIASLFAADAEIANPLVQYAEGGQQAAKTFWGQYRDAFTEIRSEFRTVKDADGVSFLEWTSRGSIDGKPFTYEGVSVLESEGDKITAFRTYFDTRHIPSARSKGGDNTGRVQISGQAREGRDGQSVQDGDGDMVQAQREAAEQRSAGGYQ